MDSLNNREIELIIRSLHSRVEYFKDFIIRSTDQEYRRDTLEKLINHERLLAKITNTNKEDL